MKKLILLISVVFLILSIFSGCTDNAEENINQNNNTTSADASDNSSDGVEISEISVEYSEFETDSSYDQSDATIVNLDDEETSIEGSGAAFKDNVVNILNAGTYILSGTLNGQVVVNATNVDEIQIVLDNANITNNQGTAIYIRQAEIVTLTLAEGSTNTITDGSTYSDTSDDAPDSAIFSDDDLTINGTGTLIIEGNHKHGIKCADDLTIINGNISVNAVNDGIRGKDSVAILDGNITVTAGGDGITATNSDDTDKGWISVDGGVFDIIAENNGFQAESALIINAGEINVEANQDTYHCNNDIVINGGTSNLEAGDDGMHADGDLQIVDGDITVDSNYEGIEGANVYVAGGTIWIEALDDGINAAGGSDSDMPEGDRFKSQSGDNVINISGGDIYISCIGNEGDGLDSNGDIYISGGTVLIDGAVSQMDSAIDINNGTFEYSGGTLASVGGSSMLVIPSTVSQPVITVIFGSNQQAGKTIELLDSNGNVVVSFTPDKTYSVAMLSSPYLTVGETYTVTMGGSELFTISLDTTSVTVDGNGNTTNYTGTGGHGGQNSGGMHDGGGKPGRGGQ